MLSQEVPDRASGQRAMTAVDAFQAYLAAFNGGDVAALAALYAPGAVFVNPLSPRPITTRAAIQDFVGPMFAVYADMTAIADDVIAVADRVAARLTIDARHIATGRVVELRTGEFLRTGADGLITEHVRIFDSAAIPQEVTWR